MLTTTEILPTQIGKYRILGKLGHGGMGTVYKAWHPTLKRNVAIKVLPAKRSDDPAHIDRFQREWEAVGKLDHLNVVRAFDADESNGTHFLVMEFLDGCDLNQLCKKGKLSIANTCEIVRQAALGLQYIHENGLVHRDLKPSNLFLTLQGQVKILDLGLAKLRNEAALLQLTENFIGTCDYAAPEQALNAHDVDIRADIYSLGCTLYRLLSGQVVFSDDKYDSPMRKLQAHISEPIRPINELKPDLPSELVKLVNRMLHKSPADRPKQPSLVAAALAPFCQGSKLDQLLAKAPSAMVFASEGDISSDRLASGETAPFSDTPSKSTAKRFSLSWTQVAAGVCVVVVLALAAWGVILLNGLAASQGDGVVVAGAVESPNSGESAPAPPGDASTPATPATVEPASEPAPQPTKPTPEAPVPEANSPVVSPLAQEWNDRLGFMPKEIFWPGHHFVRTFRFDEQLQALEVVHPHISLIQLGQWQGKPPTRFRVDIEQDYWQCRMGLFFGYHEQIEQGARHCEFQLIMLHNQPRQPNPRPTLDVRRTKMLLRASGVLSPYQGTTDRLHPEYLPSRQLAVEFDGKSLKRVTVDGQSFPDIVTDQINNQFGPEFYEGPWGIFVENGPALFRNPVLE